VAEATAGFIDRFNNGGGELFEIIKAALSNPDFAPFL